MYGLTYSTVSTLCTLHTVQYIRVCLLKLGTVQHVSPELESELCLVEINLYRHHSDDAEQNDQYD